MRRNLHQQILIEKQFLPKETSEFLVNYIRDSNQFDLEVFDNKRSTPTGQAEWELRKDVRNTQSVDARPIVSLLQTIYKRAVIDCINPFYNVQVQTVEVPQLLRYGQGGHYKPHPDGEALFNNYGQIEWRRNVDRDISLIIYLNNRKEYQGGDLVFPDLNLTLEPECGMLVAFPSYHLFAHGVKPITSGERFSFVTWMSLNPS